MKYIISVHPFHCRHAASDNIKPDKILLVGLDSSDNHGKMSTSHIYS